MKALHFSLVVVAITTLVGSTGAGATRQTGAITTTTYHGPGFGDSETYITYPTKNGAQGTYWVWRVSKPFPDATIFCGGSAINCSASRSIAKGQSWTALGGSKVSFGWSEISGSVSYTASTTETFTQTITVGPGTNAYINLIVDNKWLPQEDVRGAWEVIGTVGRTMYKYRWNNDITVGHFSGNVSINGRISLCATKKVLSFNEGSLLPHECTPAHQYR